MFTLLASLLGPVAVGTLIHMTAHANVRRIPNATLTPTRWPCSPRAGRRGSLYRTPGWHRAPRLGPCRARPDRCPGPRLWRYLARMELDLVATLRHRLPADRL